MQASRTEIGLESLLENSRTKDVMKHITKFLDLPEISHLPSASKSFGENIILKILSPGRNPESLYEFIKAFRLTKEYASLRVNEYKPENPVPFILRVLLEGDIYSLPIEQIKEVLKHKDSPISELNQNDWNRLKASMAITCAGIKYNLTKEPGEKSEQLEILLKRIEELKKLDELIVKSEEETLSRLDNLNNEFDNLSKGYVKIPSVQLTENEKKALAESPEKFVDNILQKYFYQGTEEEYQEIRKKLESLFPHPQLEQRFRDEQSVLERKKAGTYINLSGVSVAIKSKSSPIFIRYVNFSNIQFAGNLTLSGQRLNFQNGNMDNLVWNRPNLEFCNFENLNAESIYMKNCALKCVNFKNAKLQNGKFGMSEPIIRESLPSDEEFIKNPLRVANDNALGKHFVTIARAAEELAEMILDSQFNSADLRYAQFVSIYLTNVEFKNSNLENATFSHLNLKDVNLIEAKLNSCQFVNCIFVNVSWINFESIDPVKLKAQLDALQNMWTQHSPEDRSRLTKSIFSDFKSGINKVEDQRLKVRLLECAKLTIFGFEEQNLSEKKSVKDLSTPFFDGAWIRYFSPKILSIIKPKNISPREWIEQEIERVNQAASSSVSNSF